MYQSSFTYHELRTLAHSLSFYCRTHKSSTSSDECLSILRKLPMSDDERFVVSKNFVNYE